MRVNALAQKAEYLWYDGQEGQPIKVRWALGGSWAGRVRVGGRRQAGPVGGAGGRAGGGMHIFGGAMQSQRGVLHLRNSGMSRWRRAIE